MLGTEQKPKPKLCLAFPQIESSAPEFEDLCPGSDPCISYETVWSQLFHEGAWRSRLAQKSVQ